MLMRDRLYTNYESRKIENTRKAKELIAIMGIIAIIRIAIRLFFYPREKELHKNMKMKANNFVENIEDSIQNKANAMKRYEEHTSQTISDFIDQVTDETEQINKNIKHGLHTANKKVKKSAENTIEKIDDTIEESKESMRKFTARNTQKVMDKVNDINDTTDDVKDEINDGFKKVIKGFRKKIDKIS